jgi:mannose-6-phosphate isomerase-like protein (cupin superfamily)
MIERYCPEPLTLTTRVLFQNEDESCVRIELDGVNDRIVNELSRTTYCVESGYGAMVADGKYYDLAPGTKITVPKNVIYQDAGRKLVMHALSVPPFDPTQVRKV